MTTWVKEGCRKIRSIERELRKLEALRAKLDRKLERAQDRFAVRMKREAEKNQAAVDRALSQQAKFLAAQTCKNRSPAPPKPKKSRIVVPGKVISRQWPDLVTPSGAFPVKLRVVSVDDVITSHNPINWSIDPRYPSKTQERRYDAKHHEQLKVTKISRSLNPSILLANTPSALTGPPVVAVHPSGTLIALGGNGRTMGVKLAYDRGGADEYHQAVKKTLRLKTIPTRAIVVRQLEPPPSLETWAWWTRELNRSLGDGMDLTSSAVSIARSMPDQVVSILAGRDLSTTLRSSKGREVVRALQRSNLVGSGEAGLFEKDGLSEQGRALVRRALAGAVLGSADLIETLPATAVDHAARAGASILEAARVAGEKFDLRPSLQAAARDFADASRWPGGVEKYLSEFHLTPPESKSTDFGPAVLKSWVGGSLVDFANKWLSVARSRPLGQVTVFPDPRKLEQIANDLVA